MRAVICSKFGSPEDLEVKEVEEPVIGANQVKLKVEACGVNFPDTLIINNKYQFKPDLPFSPGGEVAGIVGVVHDTGEVLDVGGERQPLGVHGDVVLTQVSLHGVVADVDGTHTLLCVRETCDELV